MKIRQFIPAAVCLALLAACDNSTIKKDTNASGPAADATFADSVSWYLGESASLSYWQKAANDSLTATDNGKSAYEKGFRKGLEMLTEDNAYNDGIRDAMMMSQTFSYLKNTYDVNINRSQLFAGLEKGLASDSAVNRMELQQQMASFFNRLQKEKEQKDRLAADKIISEIATKRGFKKISDGFYYKIDSETIDTLRLARGQKVWGKVEVKNLSGQSVLPPQVKEEIRVGGFPSHIVNEALMMMYPHSTFSFMTTAGTLFESRMPGNKGITGESPVIWTISLDGYVAAENNTTDKK